MTSTILRVFPVATATVLFFAGLGCKQEKVGPSPFATPAPNVKSGAAAMPAGHPPVDPMVTGTVPAPPTPSASDAIAWDLPKGWTEARAGGMRFATLKPPASGKIDGSVVMLPGEAGGELANVNRWRGQIGLTPIDEATRLSLRREVKSKIGAIAVYDFTGEGAGSQRMIAGLVVVEGRSWFFKLTGDPDSVAASQADFSKLLESLRSPAK